MGLKLSTTFLEADLPAPQLAATSPRRRPQLAGLRLRGRDGPSLLPFLQRLGAVRPANVDIDTLEACLRARSPPKMASNSSQP
jgi:hypothetical protein